MPREYNGLTGAEMLDAMLLALREKLEKDGRLSLSQVYHNVHLDGEFLLSSYPHEPAVEKFSVSAVVGGEPPKIAKRKQEKFTVSEDHSIPDLTREKIANVRQYSTSVADISGDELSNDAALVTNIESRG